MELLTLLLERLVEVLTLLCERFACVLMTCPNCALGHALGCPEAEKRHECRAAEADEADDARDDRSLYGIYFDAARNRYMGAISLGYGPDGKRIRRKVSGKTKQEVRAKLQALYQEMNAGVRSSSTYTVREAVDEPAPRSPSRCSPSRPAPSGTHSSSSAPQSR